MSRSSIALAALLQGAAGLRRAHKGQAKVANVPIVNYHYRTLQVEVGGAAVADTFDWIVKFKDGVEDEQLANFCGNECSLVGHPGRGGVPLVTVRATEKKLAQMLEAQPGIAEFVEPDSPVYAEALEEQQANAPWGHGAINLPLAQYTGKGSHIYVMDTGIRVTHQDFGGRAIPTVDTMDTGSVTECDPGDSSCASDDNSHGTHVAGTAGGATYGVAKEAVLHAMKVCCSSGTNINGGMDWLAQFAQKPAVMTMSLGSYTTPDSSRVAVDAVVNSGVTVVVSAGNRGTDSCLKSYTFIASAIGAGSSTSTNARSSFSNFGTRNAIFAPGSSIVSADYGSDTGSSSKSGTSMAAPHVAGAAALLLEENPTLLAGEGVRSALQARATAGALTGLQVGDPNLLLNVGEPYTGPPTPAPPTPAPPPSGTFEVTAGTGCTTTGNCIQSNNHPSDYGNDEGCTISAWDVALTVDAFSTESGYDILTMGGTAYSGSSGPPSGTYSGVISWASDYSVVNSGWKLCKA